MSQTRKAAKAAEARKLVRAAAKSERQAQADAIAARNEDNAYHRARVKSTPSDRDPAGYSGLSQLPEERYRVHR